MNSKPKSSYAIVIAIACCLIVFGGAGTTFSTAGVFYAVVADAFGVGQGTFSIYMTIVGLLMALSLPILGKLLTKVDIRVMIAIDGVCVALSWAIFAMSQSMWMFYAAAVLQGFGVAGPMYIVVPTMASRWFHKKNGLMIGVGMAFTGIAGIVLQPILGSVVSEYGWRTGYWINAAISAVTVIIPALFMLRGQPSDVGQVPYGFEEEARENTIAAAKVASPTQLGVSYKNALRSGSFFAIAAVALCINVYTCMNFYWTSYASAIGYSLTAASAISSVAMYGQLVGKIGLGSICDKNLNVGLILAYGCGVVGLGASLFTTSSAPLAILLVCIFLYGITHGSSAVETPIIAKACFGNGKDYARIYSNVASVSSFSSAIGTTLLGYIADWTGGYEAVFILCLVLAALCFVFAKLAVRMSAKLVRE